jgi:Fe-S oxidoreductase
MDIDSDTARVEMKKIYMGRDSFVLHDCATCYACEEYCKMGNHPFYLIVERQEELDVPPLPEPLIKRGVQMGIPFRGEPEIEKIDGPVINMGAFSPLTHLIRGKLFEGLSIISDDPRKMFHYFCQLMYLHYGRASLIKERLPKIMKTMTKHNAAKIIQFHDECYGTYTSYAPAVGMDVPFESIHLFEFLYNRLIELKDAIRPVNLKVAYQRPCSSRLSPDKLPFVDAIFELIGAQHVEREYVDENALCCGGVIMGLRKEGSRKMALDLQKKNIDDMVRAGAGVCVFNCPACMETLAGPVSKRGLAPVFMSDLCRLAVGEQPAGWR